MRKLIFLLTATILFTLAVKVSAQDVIPAKPEQQAQIKPIIAALQKAEQERDTKLASLPQAQAVRDAQKALQDASTAWQKAAENLPQAQAVKKAQAALEKAQTDLQVAGNSLPESAAWKDAGTKYLDTAYRFLADSQLSSREYQPRINEKSELVYSKWTPPKP